MLVGLRIRGFVEESAAQHQEDKLTLDSTCIEAIHVGVRVVVDYDPVTLGAPMLLTWSDPIDDVVDDRALAHVPTEVGAASGIDHPVPLHPPFGHFCDDDAAPRGTHHFVVFKGDVGHMGHNPLEDRPFDTATTNQ